MAVINGRVYAGDVVMVNGRVIKGTPIDDDPSSKFIKFDETKNESSSGVDQITIDSNVDVNVSAANTKDVIAHLHGSCSDKDDINFSIKRNGRKICIVAKVKQQTKLGSSFISYSGVNQNLILDVKLPAKVFEQLLIESSQAKINVASTVKATDITVSLQHGEINVDANANAIKANCKHGNIGVSSSFQTLELECMHGNIVVKADMKSDVKLNVECKHGNVDVTLLNLGCSKVSIETKHGSCQNNPKFKGRYTAEGYISVKYGNIKFW